MKINNIKQQNIQNFKGNPLDAAGKFLAKHPVAIAGLAGSSVVAQKIVMSGSEAVIGPAMDIAIGKTITKATGETDGRTNQSSKTQAVRTAAQSIGGTITGVTIRSLAILGATLAMSKLGAKAGSKIAQTINPEKLDPTKNLYKFTQNASNWGKNIGGAAAILIMTVTNFILDVPIINWFNKKIGELVDKKQPQTPPTQTEQAKEAK